MIKNVLRRSVGDERLGRGLALLREGLEFFSVERSGKAIRGVVSGSDVDVFYLVGLRLTGSGVRCSCTCPDHVYRKKICKHIIFVAVHEMGRAATEKEAI